MRAACRHGELLRHVDAFAHGLLGMGRHREERALLCLLDTLDFATALLGCLKAGVIPIPANTLLTAPEYEFILRDSGARALIVGRRHWLLALFLGLQRSRSARPLA